MKMESGGQGSDRSGQSERHQEQHRSQPVRQQQHQQGSRQHDANKGGGRQSHANQADQTEETSGGLGRSRDR
jgi:hypothetical protein